MPSAQRSTQCPQCDYDRADTEFNCGTDEEFMHCRRCGYNEFIELEECSDGEVTFRHTVIAGAGVLSYHSKGETGYEIHYLATQAAVTKSADWLRERLASGKVYPGTAYVSRWNGEAKTVEFVVGRFYEDSDYEPD